ncbi:MAG: right-handed parallel beta-helix repeat-containing protein [Pseudomonadales bacterium]|nr:right-handed parallel beta-helix repeat-containing protein [Pseudomonadales bacterium]
MRSPDTYPFTICYWLKLGFIATIFFLSASAQAYFCATPGKDGAGGTLSGIINTYYPASSAGTVSAGSTSIPVGSPTGAATAVGSGDLLLIIQMQGAELNSSNTNSYGDGVSGDPAQGSTGIVAGNYEFVRATSAVGGGSVSIQGLGAGNGLINSYYNDAPTATRGRRTFQVIRVPQYTTATLSSSLTASPWNGSTGGVIAIDVEAALTLNGTVDLTGYGFRGGGALQIGYSGGPYPSDYRSLSTAGYHASKGEGTAGTPRYVYSTVSNTITNTGIEGYPNGSFANGAPGNAGGGGDDVTAGTNHNAGGGGGSNGGQGGRGGYTWNGSTANGNNIGGFPGATFNASASSIVMGGGGGAGGRNNSSGVMSSGGAGGGIFISRSNSITGSGTITVNGGNGVTAENDGSGGGGAGGSVLMYTTTGNFSGLTVNARGGNGGNAWPTQGGSSSNAHGPGGGGGGGAVLLSAGGASVNTSGGTNGTTLSSALPYGAGSGSSGSSSTSLTGTSIPGISGGGYCFDMTGTLFDDVNYGGGTGRNYSTANSSATSSGFANNAIASSGSTVELYTSTGAYISNATTDASGSYSFTERIGSYQIRAVNSTINSVRGNPGVSPVQTYRTTASSGSAVAVTNEIGGANPADTDAAANGGSSSLATLNAPANTTVQSLAPATITSANIPNIDFGFNFDTIVNTNDSGQGSFRQFIDVANTLANTNLNQDSNGITDPAASVETSIFMLPSSALSSGVGVINVNSDLSAITDNATHIDGRTQTANTVTSSGNSNSGSLGSGGTVGTTATALSSVARPEIEIVDNAGALNGLYITADDVTVRNISIHGFGSNNANADIRVQGAFTGINITENIIGASASSFSLPASDSYIGIFMGGGGTTASITNNLIGFTQRFGVRINNNATDITFTGNEVSNTGLNQSQRSAVYFDQVGTGVFSGNLIEDNAAAGVQFDNIGTTFNLSENTIRNNGSGGSITAGIAMYNTTTATTSIAENIINGNSGNGIFVATTQTGTTISQNSLYNNGQLGIDLHTDPLDVNGVSPYVTQNDDGDSDTGSNNLLNFPVITGAGISGSNLIVSGFAPAGASIEWFIADGGTNPNPNSFSIDFGEGQTYLTTTVEGSGSDTDSTTGSYTGDSCAAAPCTANKFSFSIPVPGGVSIGTTLTSTATTSDGTSEFSGVYVVTGFPLIMVSKTSVTYSDPVNALSNPKAIPGATMIYTITVTNMGDGNVDLDSISIVDPVPVNTTFVSGNFDGSTTGPIKFSNGTPSSGLSLTFNPASEGSDDIDFATDGVPTWNASSTDTPITHIRFRPQGTMAFDNNPALNPNFSIQFKVTID